VAVVRGHEQRDVDVQRAGLVADEDPRRVDAGVNGDRGLGVGVVGAERGAGLDELRTQVRVLGDVGKEP
jgi:hypothetical protein